MFRFSYLLRQSLLVLLFCGFVAGVTSPSAQSLAVVQVLPGTPGRLLIEGAGPAGQAWSFRDSYAGIVGLGERVRGFQVFDGSVKQVEVRRMAPGQCESAEPAATF